MPEESPGPRVHHDRVLRLILEGTVAETGTAFFRALVRNLAQALGTCGAWVTEYLADQRRLRSLAFWLDGGYVDQYEYDTEGTPCQPVIERRCLVHFAERVMELFPRDVDLKRFNAVSYIGVPLSDTDGNLLGHLAALDRKPMPVEPDLVPVFEVFAARAAAEHQRLKVESEVRAHREQLARTLDSAMDAILVLDAEMNICRVNPAAERVLACSAERLTGADFRRFLEVRSRGRLETYVAELDRDTHAQLWIPQSLEVRPEGGKPFPAEATLSRFENRGAQYFTLILRNIDERIEAERRIRQLAQEAEYLRDAFHDLPGADEILGTSPAVAELLESIGKVAPTDTAVLLLGETGTGKELVARAIHRAGRRSQGPMIRVNCAAVPANLMESEFFGHEKGAFTGATARRDGRFTLADGGTIFLDEIGELPPDLQAKLLRVLQEGEFEPLGSPNTRHVDVRVIAATNRDLQAMVEKGEFREDLFYRLGVFPLRLPPLRERGEDVGLLAAAFVERYARRLGRRFEPLEDRDVSLLRGYAWPGNVRELQNVIERAIILSPGPRLELARAMPSAAPAPAAAAVSSPAEPGRILTADEMQAVERKNIERALEAAGGKVAGRDGAAARLGLRPSTLNSRMKALGIRRPSKPAD